ncbi:Retrovirus-related Pol polyprotein from transposon TNT 1-94, partial [Linum grandiflorum]
NFIKEVQNDKQITIGKIRSDNGGEFISQDFKNLCESLGIIHEFSVARTPQQNGVVERKNRTLVDIARTMLNDFSVPTKFWAEAVNTACYVINRVLIRKNTMKTPYEIWKNLKPNISYFHPFGCRCFILNTKDHLGKFDAKSDEGIFLGYSNLSKAYRVFNKRSNKIEESIHVLFDQTLCEDANLQDTFDEDFGLIPIESMPIQDNSNSHISELSTGDINREKDLKQAAGNSNLEAISNSIGHETNDLDKQAPPHIIQRHPPSQVIGNFNERYQSCPRDNHLSAVKRIFRYLKGTMELGLWYPTEGTTELLGYSDSDFAGSQTDRRSTSGSCQYLGTFTTYVNGHHILVSPRLLAQVLHLPTEGFSVYSVEDFKILKFDPVDTIRTWTKAVHQPIVAALPPHLQC